MKVFNGSNTLFWKDPWCDNGVCLKDSFPRLFALELQQDCKVKDRWCTTEGVWGGNWSWRLSPRGRAVSDLNYLLATVGNFTLGDDRDNVWSWSWDASGTFKVKTLATIVQNSILSGCDICNHHLWNSLVARKVNICVWCAYLNRMPTRSNLSSRGVPLSSTLCPFCGLVNEDLEHCLIKCSMVLPIWRKVWSWWGLPSPIYFPSFSIKDIALGKIGSINCTKTSKILQGVFHCALWSVWKWRNKLVNAQMDVVDSVKREDIFPFVQRISRDWISAPLNSNAPNWSRWIARPFDLFM